MATKDEETLGAYLRAVRQEAGLSIAELARLTQINRSYLVKLENDQNSNPSAEKLQRLAAVLEVDASELLRFIGVEPSSTLPSPRVYFRRKLGISEAEATELDRLVEEFTQQRKHEGEHLT